MKKKIDKEKQIARICAKLQMKLIYKGKWLPIDRKRWDLAISELKNVRDR